MLVLGVTRTLHIAYADCYKTLDIYCISLINHLTP